MKKIIALLTLVAVMVGMFAIPTAAITSVPKGPSITVSRRFINAAISSLSAMGTSNKKKLL